MAKIKTSYFCQSCGYESAKWLGKCPSCNQWNTFVEEIIEKANTSIPDWKTGSTQLDASAAVQLAMYRLAWAKLSGTDIEKISAAFHYVPTSITDRPADLLDEAALIALIANARGDLARS